MSTLGSLNEDRSAMGHIQQAPELQSRGTMTWRFATDSTVIIHPSPDRYCSSLLGYRTTTKLAGRSTPGRHWHSSPALYNLGWRTTRLSPLLNQPASSGCLLVQRVSVSTNILRRRTLAIRSCTLAIVLSRFTSIAIPPSQRHPLDAGSPAGCISCVTH